MKPILYLVIPCYNEQEVLPETSKRLLRKMNALISGGAIAPESRIAFVDDGSKDDTWQIIDRLHRENPLFSGIKLSRNRGHQNALLAGLMTVKEHCDCAISLDADLQDDIEVIDQFVEKFSAGCDVVYGVRSSRKTDSVFKRSTAESFYKVMKALGVDIVYNHADYRLLSRRVLDHLADYKEVNLFLRGIVPLIGFPSAIVEYERSERFAGESKYPLKKMLAFAFDGITSFSVKPIKFIWKLGLVIIFCSCLGLIWALISALLGHLTASFTAFASSLWLLGGIQLTALGIVGEYVGKIYLEVKGRPRFIIDRFLNQ